MPTCAARDCQNRTGMEGPKKTFHMFPKNPSLRERWLYVTGRRNWVPGPRAVLCSDHFEEQCFDRTGQTTRLRAGALPTRGKFTPRRKGRGAVKLEPFYVPVVKQEPQDPSYTPFTTPSSPKKRGPGRPRKHPPPEAVQEQNEDDPTPLPSQSPQEDHPHLDHYYCRNYHETQSLLRQKEKKAEYLKMKLQFLEGETKVKQDLPDWSQFRRATLMEEAEEVRRQLRLSGKLPPTDGRRKTEKGETLTMKTGKIEMLKTGKIEMVPRNSDQLPKRIQIITGKTGEKIQVVSGNIDGMTEKSEMTKRTDGVTSKIQVLTGSADRPSENVKIVTRTPDGMTGTIQVVAEEPDRKPERIQVLARKVQSNFAEDGLKESLDHWDSENKLKQKEQEVNDLLKKIKTLQQRKRREKRRSKARFFRYVVMVEPSKKKRGRKKQAESDGEEDEEEDDGDIDVEQDENEEEEEEEDSKDDVKLAVDPLASIQDSILSHTASLMLKQQHSSELIQKDKEIRELRRSVREIQERETERLEQIQHLQDVISYLKTSPVKTLDTDDHKADNNEDAEAEQDDQRLRRIEDVVAEEVVIMKPEEVEGCDSDQVAVVTQRHCRLCLCSLHQRCHKRPRSWSSSTLDPPPSHSPASLLPFMHSSVHRKSRLSLRRSKHPLCSDCRLILGRRKRSQTSVISSLSYNC